MENRANFQATFIRKNGYFRKGIGIRIPKLPTLTANVVGIDGDSHGKAAACRGSHATTSTRLTVRRPSEDLQ